MERRSFQTPLGEVWLWGSDRLFSGAGTVILAVNGAFARQPERLARLERVLPVAVASMLLPGLGAPELERAGVAAYAEAADSIVSGPLSDRVRLLLGESAGALVALAMSGDIPRLALEPPLLASSLRHWHDRFREQLRADPTCGPFLWETFGVAAERFEDLDYTALLNRPATIMAGTGSGSVIGEPERALMRSMAHIQLQEVPGANHDIPGAAAGIFCEAVKRLL